MENDPQYTFKTKDLYLSAFLIASGEKLLGVEGEPREYWFMFADKEKCEDLSIKYWSGEKEVNAKKFSDSLRTLKDIIFAKT